MTKAPDSVVHPVAPLPKGRRRAAVLIVVAVLAGCEAGAGASSLSPQGGPLVMGSGVAKPSVRFHRNAGVSRKLTGISERLAAVAGIDPVSVFVVNASTANAALAPDGNIYLTRRLVLLTDDDSELAAVIAHELSHKISGHVAARSALGTEVAVSSTEISKLLPDSAEVKALIAEKSERVAALAREQELQADAMAIHLLGKAGYDPLAIARFLRIMQANDNEQVLDRPTYTTYHPSPDMRIERAEAFAAGLRNKSD